MIEVSVRVSACHIDWMLVIQITVISVDMVHTAVPVWLKLLMIFDVLCVVIVVMVSLITRLTIEVPVIFHTIVVVLIRDVAI